MIHFGIALIWFLRFLPVRGRVRIDATDPDYELYGVTQPWVRSHRLNLAIATWPDGSRKFCHSIT